MRIELCEGPIENEKLIALSPLERIAKVLDYFFPELCTDILKIISEEGIAKIKEEYKAQGIGEEITEENYQRHLPEIFWAIAKSGNVYDIMFFFDYYVYINFFLQYPRVMGREMEAGCHFQSILEEYKNAAFPKEVFGVTANDEFTVIVREDGDEEKIAGLDDYESLDDVDDLLGEVFYIDRIIEKNQTDSRI